MVSMIQLGAGTACLEPEPFVTALDQFQRAPLELLERRALLKRADTKFVIPARLLPHFIELLTDEYALLESSGALQAEYRTLYYDSPALDMFHAHRRGVRPRKKIRVRHYMEREVTFLEQKIKRPNDKTVKSRIEREFGESEFGDDELLEIGAQAPSEDLVPVVWTNFKRATLLGVDAMERVTIDACLEFRAGDVVVGLPELAIIEVKQPRVNRSSTVWRALRELGVRPLSVSKYCTAVCLLYPDVRQARMKTKLKQLRRIAS